MESDKIYRSSPLVYSKQRGFRSGAGPEDAEAGRSYVTTISDPPHYLREIKYATMNCAALGRNVIDN